MQKIRVLQVIPHLGKAGAERMAAEICYGLSKRDDVEVLLITFSPTNTYKQYTDYFPCRVCSSWINLSISGKTEKNMDDYIKIVNEFKPHIIHSHLFKADLLSREILFPNVKYFSHQHGANSVFLKPSIDKFVKKSSIVKMYERERIISKYRKCNNTFIAVSKYIESYLKKNLPADIQKIVMLYNAINVKNFKNNNPRKCNYHKEINNELKIISAGTLIPRKNQKLQIEIMQELINRGINAKLMILGEGEEKQNLIKLTQEKGLSDYITYVGNVDNISEYYHNSDIMLHTSKDEPFGLVLVEAMAAGLPCIALDGKGNKEIIIDGQNGFIIPEQIPSLFADKIQYILDSDEIWERFSANASITAAQYDINPYINKLISVYKQSLNFI